MGKIKRSEADYLYQRGGVWNARITINGKQFRSTLSTADREEAERRLIPWLKSISPYHGTVRHTWETAAMKWWDAMSHGWKPKTAISYRKVLALLDKHFEGMFWDQVNDKGRLIQFIEDRRKLDKAQSGTIKLNLMVLSGIANYVRHLPEWPPHNAVMDLPKHLLKKKKRRFLRPSGYCFDRIFAHMHGTFRDLCEFALLTGMRLDEIVPLERRDCRDGKITIEDQKSGKVSVLEITPAVQAIIDRQKPHPRCPNLFVTQNGGPYKTVSNLWRSVSLRAQNMAHKNGVAFQRCTFHGLRHEYAIRFLENGGSIYRLKDLLRHANVKQTEEYLDNLTAEQQARVKR